MMSIKLNVATNGEAAAKMVLKDSDFFASGNGSGFLREFIKAEPAKSTLRSSWGIDSV